MAEGAPPSIQAATPSAVYGERIARFERERDHFQQLWEQYGNTRLVVCFAMFGIAVFARYEGSWLIAGAIAPVFIVFAWLVRRHRGFRRELDRARLMIQINREEIWRIERDFARIPIRRQLGASAAHPYARDLDVMGKGSLQHLIDTTQTRMGTAQFGIWLSEETPLEETVARQERVRVLTPMLEWRQELIARGRARAGKDLDPAPLLAWCESPPAFAGNEWIRAVVRGSPVLACVCVVFFLVGVLPWALAAIPIGLNLWLYRTKLGGVNERITVIADATDGIAQYARLLEHLETFPGEGAVHRDINARLYPDGVSATRWVKRLQRRASFAMPPGSILYFPAQILLNWDLNVLLTLETWKAEAGARVRDWITLIGEIEALSAFAGLAFNQPDWTFPTIDPTQDRFSAEGLGHPLLSDASRVANDVEVGPPGTVLLVTGSNMSGKSTLLRAIGINAVLGMAGAPVCAKTLTMPPVRIWTSVRVEDSVVNHVSFYMAELLRLKAVVDASKANAIRQLYLLDEILQGTNTAERQIAARTIIRALIDAGSIGAVSTHDLELANGPELDGSTTLVHFRDDVTRDGLSFDYVLRPGLATSTNALKLMEFVFGRGEPQASSFKLQDDAQ